MGSGSPLIRLEMKLCLATSASSVPLVRYVRCASAIFCLVSFVCFRVLPHEREQYSPRLVCLAWHLGHVFSLYATGDAHYHCKHDFSSSLSTTP